MKKTATKLQRNHAMAKSDDRSPEGKEAKRKKWYFVSEDLPPIEKLLTVFRHKNKKYMHAFYKELKVNEYPGDESTEFVWVTQHNSVHSISSLDAWQELDYLIIGNHQIIYDGKHK